MQDRRNRAVKLGLILTLVLFAVGQPYGVDASRPVEHLVLADECQEVRHIWPEDEASGSAPVTMHFRFYTRLS